MPSVVFAEAGWYGSLRSGLQFGGGEDAKLVDAFSRFGIKGSNEVSDGLTAVYRFETKINTTNANLDGGRLSYVGVSGGFGSLTIGQVWSASYNHAGGVFDLANYGGGTNTSGRVGNALSYSISAGSVSAQIDAIMDGTKNSSSAIDQFEFGLSFNMGDIGKIGFAHVNKKDTLMDDTVPAMTFLKTLAESERTAKTALKNLKMIEVTVAKNYAGYDSDTGLLKSVTGTDAAAIKSAIALATNGKYSLGTCTADDASTPADESDTTDGCVMAKAYVQRTTTEESAAATDAITTVTTGTYHLSEELVMTPKMTMTKNKMDGSKANHLAVQFNLGAITAHLGASQIKMNNMAKKTKVAHFGVNGGLGDTGLSFYAAGRNIKPAEGMKTTPWVVGLNKKLGDGAKVWFEHENADNGESGTTTVGLNVDF